MVAALANEYRMLFQMVDRVRKLRPNRPSIFHGIDAIALIHALIIRMQAIVMSMKVLVFANFGGGH